MKGLTVVVHAVSAKSGGAATYLRNLLPALRPLLGETGRLILCVPPAAARALGALPRGVRVIQTDVAYGPGWRRLGWDQVVLRQLVRREKADVLLSSSDFGLFFPPCRQVLLVRNPLYFSALYLREILPRKSWHYRLGFFLRRRLIALSVRHSDVVVCASQSMLQDLQRWVRLPDRKAFVIPFGVSADRFSPLKPGSMPPGAATRLLYVSEYSDYKNLTVLLRALWLLAQRHAGEFTLTTTLDPKQFPDTEISSRAEDSTLMGDPLVRLRLAGPVPYDQLPALYREHDLFIFPSLAESFGHPLVEAMASGLPVVASDLPICREICGEAALYFNPLNPEELAQRILLLRGDSRLREELSEKGRRRAVERFDWARHVSALYETLRGIVNGGHKE